MLLYMCPHTSLMLLLLHVFLSARTSIRPYQALLRLYYGSINALLTLYDGSITALLRRYYGSQGSIKALLRLY
jgi:hypothetical protein